MAKQVNIKVPVAQVVTFNAILAKHNLTNKLTAALGADEVTYTGNLEDSEVTALNQEVAKLGMGNIIKTVIGFTGKVLNKVVNVGVNSITVPTVQEAGKVVASTAKTAGVGAVKIGASLFSSTVKGFTTAKSEVSSSDEWSEAKRLATTLFGSNSITIS